jgi:hypothetical protein
MNQLVNCVEVSCSFVLRFVRNKRIRCVIKYSRTLRYHWETLFQLHILIQWRTERGVWGVQPPIPRNSEAEPNSGIREKEIRNNLIRIRVSLIFKLSGTPD